MSFKNKTVFISGGTRGIGHAIGLKLASEGANIVIAAKQQSRIQNFPVQFTLLLRTWKSWRKRISDQMRYTK